jgi:hypothetical protein
MPTPRGGLGAAIVKGSLIALGGEEPTRVDASAEAYDLASGTWSILRPLPEPRHGLAVAAAGDRLIATGGSASAGHGGSSTTTLDFQLTGSGTPGPSAVPSSPSPSASSSSGPAATTSAGLASTIYQGCGSFAVTRGRMLGSKCEVLGLAIGYTTNFTPSAAEDSAHYHLHLFTANTMDGTSTDPSDSIMRGSAAPGEGSWFNLYANGVPRIDATTPRGGRQAALDLEHHSLPCVRVATGMHDLVKDSSGGFRTGNCVPIHR